MLMWNWIKRRIIISVIGLLKDSLQKWIDDPDTDTDQNAVNAVAEYIEYLATK